jgi:hypothetical protein
MGRQTHYSFVPSSLGSRCAGWVLMLVGGGLVEDIIIFEFD